MCLYRVSLTTTGSFPIHHNHMQTKFLKVKLVLEITRAVQRKTIEEYCVHYGFYTACFALSQLY